MDIFDYYSDEELEEMTEEEIGELVDMEDVMHQEEERKVAGGMGYFDESGLYHDYPIEWLG